METGVRTAQPAESTWGQGMRVRELSRLPHHSGVCTLTMSLWWAGGGAARWVGQDGCNDRTQMLSPHHSPYEPPGQGQGSRPPTRCPMQHPLAGRYGQAQTLPGGHRCWKSTGQGCHAGLDQARTGTWAQLTWGAPPGRPCQPHPCPLGGPGLWQPGGLTDTHWRWEKACRRCSHTAGR